MALVFFTSPAAPVQCAVEISTTLKEHPELRVRMGIHSGPVSEIVDLNEQSNVAGGGINMAQRVMDCADAGHILLSKRVAEDLVQYRQWQPFLHDVGAVEVKHGFTVQLTNFYGPDFGNPAIPDKCSRGTWTRRTRTAAAGSGRRSTKAIAIAAAAVAIVLAAAGIWWFAVHKRGEHVVAALPTAEMEKSIAVLPFQYLSADPDNAFFANGVQDEILTTLAQLADLKVISRTSVMQFRDPEKRNLREIAQALNVAHVLEGSVQRSANRVRVMAQLIDARTDTHLWAERYDGDLADVFAIQSEIALKIAGSLQAKLSARERSAMAKKLTDNMAAYDAYLRGIDFSSRPGRFAVDGRKAADAFAEAVRLDPQFAQAWARLSRSCALLYVSQYVGSAARKELARTAVETATRLQPSAPETRLANAYYRYHVERNYEGARQLFENIQREIPSSSEALDALAFIARRQSRWKDSIRLHEEAAKLNPRDPSLFMTRASTFWMVRDWPRNLEMIEQAEALAPGDADLLTNKTRIYQNIGDLAAARRVLDQIKDRSKAVDVMVRQAMLERRYDEGMRLLEEKLSGATPIEPVKGGTYRQWLGWFRSLAGDSEGARKEYLQAKTELEKLQREQSKNIFVSGALAQVEAGLGNKEAALREAERGVAILPTSEDPVMGPGAEETLALVETAVGEHDRAIDRIERLLHTPYINDSINVAVLRLAPIWDPLRADPRFKAIVEGPEPKTIYN
ncbi:hypothetical protein BH20VER1_BH20VER1_05140 [soil metagenome]